MERKLDEYQNLENRLNRYWKKLVLEGMREAQSQGLVSRVDCGDDGVSGGLHLSSDVVVKRQGDEVDASELIELARKKNPSLYRRYQEGMKKYNQLRDYLKSVLEEQKS